MNVLQKESKIHKPLVRLSWGSQKEDITANLMKIREIRECQITEIGSRSN